MGAKSKIEWTEASWNPIRGVKGKWHCTHVSEGCRNCYAERMNIRMGGPAYKPGADGVRLDEKILGDPLRWKRPRRIFVCSMTDLFHESIPVRWIAHLFNVMSCAMPDCHRRHKHEDECWTGDPHIFQVLTKRPERMMHVLSKELPGRGELAWRFGNFDVQWPLPNVWLGVSVEDQKTADERIPLLLQTPAAIRWVSYEPALGPVDVSKWLCCDRNNLRGHLHLPSLDWIVCGGESGPGARPMHPDWARSARDQCQAAGVPFFFKQWGEWLGVSAHNDSQGVSFGPGFRLAAIKSIQRWDGGFHRSYAKNEMVASFMRQGEFSVRVGKKAAGRLLDGREWNEYPSVQPQASNLLNL